MSFKRLLYLQTTTDYYTIEKGNDNMHRSKLQEENGREGRRGGNSGEREGEERGEERKKERKEGRKGVSGEGSEKVRK